MPNILQGIRVVDWTVFMAGPTAGVMLADLGAEVIHVEETKRGDPMRGMASMGGAPALLPGGRQAMFEVANRNKKSLAINLKESEAREVIYRLVRKSDVFVTNQRMKAAYNLGMDPDTLRKQNPQLIYAHASLFGHKGPDSEVAGFELSGYARSGVMMSSGEPDTPPIRLTLGLGDRASGVFLAYGIVSALLAREKWGVVYQVNSSMLGAMISLIAPSVSVTLLGGQQPGKHDRAKTREPLYNWYRCKDGRWIALGLQWSDRYWPLFCKALEVPEWENDPRFLNSAKRAENCELLIKLLDEIFAERTYQEWYDILSKYDLLFSVINQISDLASDPQVIANQYIQDYDHPDLGQVKVVGFPIEFSAAPFTLGPAPHHGQHTEEVLLEICDYSWADIEKLRDSGVI